MQNVAQYDRLVDPAHIALVLGVSIDETSPLFLFAFVIVAELLDAVDGDFIIPFTVERGPIETSVFEINGLTRAAGRVIPCAPPWFAENCIGKGDVLECLVSGCLGFFACSLICRFVNSIRKPRRRVVLSYLDGVSAPLCDMPF